MPKSQVEGYRQLLSELLDNDLFSGHSLPNIRNFIEVKHDLLKRYILTHHSYNDELKKLNLLWINLFINPDMLFCHKDAADTKFSRYFAPIVLIDEQDKKDIITKIHENFYEHYSNQKESQLCTLSDLQLTGIITPPAPGQMVGITFNPATDAIRLHPDKFYTDTLGAIKGTGSDKQTKFNKYAAIVTNNGQWTYYIYSAGYHGQDRLNDGHWFGKAYFAYPCSKESCCLSEAQFSSIKNICFDLLSMFALAGTLIRNKPVFDTMKDLKAMMNTMNRHQDLLSQFGGHTLAEANREELSKIWSLLRTIYPLNDLKTGMEKAGLQNVLKHIDACNPCSKTKKAFKHAITDEDGCGQLYDNGLKKDLVEKMKKMRSSKIGSLSEIGLDSWADALFKINADYLLKDLETKKLLKLERCEDRYIKALSLLLTEEIISSNLNKLGLKINESELTITLTDSDDDISKLEISYMVEQYNGPSKLIAEDKEIVIDKVKKAKPDSLSYVLLFADCFFSGVVFKVTTNYNGITTKASFISGSIPEQFETNNQINSCSYSFILKV